LNTSQRWQAFLIFIIQFAIMKVIKTCIKLHEYVLYFYIRKLAERIFEAQKIGSRF